jgi:hypothetical protein
MAGRGIELINEYRFSLRAIVTLSKFLSLCFSKGFRERRGTLSETRLYLRFMIQA